MPFSSFPSPRPLPGLKKAFSNVSSRVNSFGERKVISNVPVSNISTANGKSGNSSRQTESASNRIVQPARNKQHPQQLAKKVTIKTSVPETTIPVPFRARPVPASTYKVTFQPTLRRINKGRNEQERAVLELASTCASPVIVDDPTVDVELTEPVSFEEAAICRTEKSPVVSADEALDTNIVIASDPAPLTDMRPVHPQGPGIPPFLPRVYLLDNIMPIVPQRFDRDNRVPVYETNRDAHGTFDWDATMESYRCVHMTPERFDEFRKALVEAEIPEIVELQGNGKQVVSIPNEPVVNAHVPDDSVQVNEDLVSAVPVNAVRRKKPRNACYQRRQERRAQAWAERNALESLKEAVESAAPQVPQ